MLPGLIDMHVHLDADATIGGYRGLAYTDNFWTVVGVANAKKMLEAGFTTVRNVGSGNYNDVAIKQGVENGYVARPAHRSRDLCSSALSVATAIRAKACRRASTSCGTGDRHRRRRYAQDRPDASQDTAPR